MLNRDFIKIGIASMIIIFSISICFVGYKVNADKQKKQKIEYALVTLKDEEKKINGLSDSVDKLFKDEQKVFLSDNLSEENIAQLSSAVLTLKTTPEDFGLKEQDINADTVLINTKKEMSQKIEDVQRKYKVQAQINGLFLQPIENWSLDVPFDNPIRATTTLNAISPIRESVGSYNDDWRKVMIAFLNDAQGQVEQYEQIKVAVESMLNEEQLTAKATYDAYTAELNKIPSIKNEELRNELSEKIDKIGSLLGVSSDNQAGLNGPVIPQPQDVAESYGYGLVDDYGNPITQ